MPTINRTDKTISMKIVFFGPGKSGKTTSIEYIRQKRGLKKVESEEAANDAEHPTFSGDETRTHETYMFPLGEVKGFKLHVTLLTVPGMIFHKAARGILLQEIDGVIFVADTTSERVYANKVLMEQLREILYEETRGDLSKVSFVIMYNKRDASDAVPVEQLEAEFNLWKYPYVEAIATQGQGVNEGFKKVVQTIINKL